MAAFEPGSESEEEVQLYPKAGSAMTSQGSLANG